MEEDLGVEKEEDKEEARRRRKRKKTGGRQRDTCSFAAFSSICCHQRMQTHILGSSGPLLCLPYTSLSWKQSQ